LSFIYEISFIANEDDDDVSTAFCADFFDPSLDIQERRTVCSKEEIKK
jgi:hypothetical protein